MQRALHTNTYQFLFFVCPVIFIPNPTVPYLCSQLASVTKGLCKQLLQANRFFPTSEETASYAAPICPPGMCTKTCLFFHFCLLVSTLRVRERWRKKERRLNKACTKSRGLTTFSFQINPQKTTSMCTSVKNVFHEKSWTCDLNYHSSLLNIKVLLTCRHSGQVMARFYTKISHDLLVLGAGLNL